MDFEFVRHEPFFNPFLFVLMWTGRKWNERILILRGTANPLPAAGTLWYRPVMRCHPPPRNPAFRIWTCTGWGMESFWSIPTLESPALQPLATACAGKNSRGISCKKISYRWSSENVCCVPYLERIFTCQRTKRPGDCLWAFYEGGRKIHSHL